MVCVAADADDGSARPTAASAPIRATEAIRATERGRGDAVFMGSFRGEVERSATGGVERKEDAGGRSIQTAPLMLLCLGALDGVLDRLELVDRVEALESIDRVDGVLRRGEVEEPILFDQVAESAHGQFLDRRGQRLRSA